MLCVCCTLQCYELKGHRSTTPDILELRDRVIHCNQNRYVENEQLSNKIIIRALHGTSLLIVIVSIDGHPRV